MKIELKKVQIFEAMSEETTAFHAEIFVNGKNVGYAKNDGHGGCTDCRPHFDKPELKELFKQTEQYCLGLPPIVYPSLGNSKGFEIKNCLEEFVDDLIEQEIKKKAHKKLEKKMLSSILIEGQRGVSGISWKGKTLAQIPLPDLQRVYDKYKKELKAGEKIINTNLAALGVKL